MIVRSNTSRVLTGVLGVLCTSPLWGQDQLLVTARSATKHAEQLIHRGQFESAAALLDDLGCGDLDECETLRQFSKGFLYESWAGSDKQHAELMLARAVDFYSAALQHSPDNQQILTNLSLAARSGGDLDTAVEAAEKLVSLDSVGAYERYLYLGDLQLAQGRQQPALQAYYSAIESNRGRPEAHRRVMDVTISIGNPGAVYDRSMKLARDFPEIAIAGLAFTINKDYKNDADRAERALTSWTALSADLGRVTIGTLGSLPQPEVWRSNGIRELHQLIQNRKIQLDWWIETSERRDAMSRLLRQQAALKRAVPESEPDAAQRYALALLNKAVEIAPSFKAYLRGPLKGKSNAQLDAASDLVSLHHAIKTDANYDALTDISADQLKHMTEVLFSGKAGAYAAGQLDAIQRYHTVLGMVYYETGRIRSDWADNAEYQLRHALKTADRVGSERPERYQPLPELEDMLADVYYRRGESGKGAERSLRASMGYLETDKLATAATALQSARENGADAGKTRAVRSILQGRNLADDREFQMAVAADDSTVMNDKLAWIDHPDTLPLDPEFVARQRFKVLADIASGLGSVGDPALARQLSAQALDNAYQQSTLTSLQDIRRIQSIENSLSGSSVETSAPHPLTITRSVDSRQTGGSDAVWSLPSGTGAIMISKEVRRRE